ncbi:hypothetical protein AKJ62_01455, partial [candidate division MSBL1 archaeon SCGC-AAA259D14]
EEEVDEAVGKLIRALEPLGIDVELEKDSLSREEFEENPTISNMIHIDGRPLEKWIDADIGQSECCEVCGDEECRTVILGGEEYEVVPADLIVNAGLRAVSRVPSDGECCSSSGEYPCCDG